MAKDHPQESLDRLQKTIQRKGVPPVVMLHGPEDHFRAQGLQIVLAHAGDRDVLHLDGSSPPESLANLGADLRTASLFGAGKIITLREDLPFGKKGAPVDLSGLVKEFLTAPTPGVHLVVLRRDKQRANSALLKGVLKAGGQVVLCRELYATPFPGRPAWSTELHAWLGQQARQRALKVPTECLELLIAVVGRSPGELAGVLNRLQVHLGDKNTAPVSQELLARLLGPGGESTQFELANALLAGSFQNALVHARKLMRAGLQGQDGKRMDGPGSALVTLSWIHRSVARCLRARCLLEQGASREEVERTLAVNYFKDRFWGEVDRSDKARLERMLEALLQAHRRLKLEGERPDRALERLVIEAVG